MQVYKFGGASIKDAQSVRNLTKIVGTNNESLIVVVSAMGKTTNAMEQLLKSYLEIRRDTNELFQKVYEYHISIARQLFTPGNEAFVRIEELFNEIKRKLQNEPSMVFNYEYDQLVSYGELISTVIVHEYLLQSGIDIKWIDIRKVLKTDDNFREANVNFDQSARLAKNTFVFKKNEKYLTQGFIASTLSNLTTTLGREGSDYTAALLASFLNAQSVTVWKDVPGVLNADPKWFDNTSKLDVLSYSDAVELAFYGASVLHPKTIQPVMQLSIPLHVKSFLNPEEEGTTIGNFKYNKLIPCFIFKVNQVLLQILPPNLSFIGEDTLELIFKIFAKYGLKINLMQNTAVSFRICVNNDNTRIPHVVQELENKYKVHIEEELELITIRYYDQETIERVLIDKYVLLEQYTETTVQMVVRKRNS